MVLNSIKTRAIEPNDAEAFLKLMGTNASPCFCRYWEFSGDKNTWLARCAEAPDVTRSEAQRAIETNALAARGVVAFEGEGDRLVGWCKVSFQPTKIFALPVYRRDAAQFQNAETAVLGCFFVHPEYRKRGIADHLVAAAIPYSKGLGAKRLLALPRRAPPIVHDEEAQFGLESIFLRAGFQEQTEGAHPILSLSL
jgi:GNAT superfamily N-acetyltransferase